MSSPTADSLEKKASSTGSIDKVEPSQPPDIDPKFERRTMLRVDLFILPILVLVYSFALIDRINLGAAYAAGMGKDLNLAIGSRFSLVTCMHFVPFIFLQLPGNLLLRWVGFRNWLTFLIVSWGSVELGMGFVGNWKDLLATRILLGVFEAPLFPAILWLISAWYKRHEVQKRIGAFYILTVTVGGLSPLLAYALSLLDGAHDIEGWRWIFIIEGAITLGLAGIAYVFLPSFPEEKNRFLSKAQTDLVVRRVNDDRGDALPDKITLGKAMHHLKDWTLWAYGLMFMCTAMPSYAQSYFVPIILTGMGYNSKDALLRSAPPYGPSIPVTMVVAYYADKWKHRSSFIVSFALICTLGNSLVAWHPSNSVRYTGVFITNIGNAGTIPSLLSFAANNVTSHSKRAVQTALMVGLGSIGGIMAATCFRSVDYPRYIPGLVATLVSQGVLLLLCGAVVLRHVYWNRKSREGNLPEPLEGQEGFYYTL